MVVMTVLSLALAWLVLPHFKSEPAKQISSMTQEWVTDSATWSKMDVKAQTAQELVATVSFFNELKSQIPAEILAKNFGVRSAYIPLSDLFDKYVAEELPGNVELILWADSMAGTKAFKVGLILDEHAHIEGQSLRSVLRQREITNLVKRLNPALTFVEGVQFTGERLTKISFAEGFRDFAKNSGWSREKVESVISNALAGQDAQTWYFELLNSPVVLYGVDHTDVNVLVILLADLKQSGYLPDTINQDLVWLNFVHREYLILASMIKVMAANNQKQAVLVVGSDHKYFFPGNCANWGVKCEIISDLQGEANIDSTR